MLPVGGESGEGYWLVGGDHGGPGGIGATRHPFWERVGGKLAELRGERERAEAARDGKGKGGEEVVQEGAKEGMYNLRKSRKILLKVRESLRRLLPKGKKKGRAPVSG